MIFFAIVWGYWALKNTPLDAIPDLSDTQVIIYTDWTGRSPDLVEDQITYPISSTLLAAPKVQAVRGMSFFGSSFIYVIFEEGTDIYWARSRVLEYLQAVRNKLPAGINPVLGPDATSLGWGFSYAVVDEKGNLDLAQLRSLQDWQLKLALESVPGVSQVASVGGFVKQYQITVDPNRLAAYNIPITKVMEAVKRSNLDVEGRVIEFSGVEYMVRGRGYIKTIKDIEDIPVGTTVTGTPIYVKNVANIQLGPEIRRGVADLDGKGEVAGGIVIVRFGENVLNVIDRVKEKLKTDIEPSLPKGVKIVTTYDRSDLIRHAITTLKDEIIKLSIAVGVVCLVFLFHLPSALVVILTLPIAIIMSFICMYYLGVTSNIMSLAGIAIAIGAMVDASIIMVENAHKKLEEWEEARGKMEDGRWKQQADGGEEETRLAQLAGMSRVDVIISAAKEVGPSLFFSLLVITVGFLPVFTLQAQAGRLFKPLAYTKTFAMLFSSFLAVTLTPVLMTLFIRGKIRPEEKNPVSRILHWLYHPVASFALRFKKTVIVFGFLVLLITAILFVPPLFGVRLVPFAGLGSEFMPPLYEGTLFYMPVTVPAASISVATDLLQLQDKLLMKIPEVSQVFGKAGRAETPTDPAPIEMFETVINMKPESEWRRTDTWYSSWAPDWLKKGLRYITPDSISTDQIKNEMNDALDIPGVSNSFTMPIKARTDMNATGIRTPVGIKVLGPNLDELEKIGLEIEHHMKQIPGTRSAYAERATTGYFLDFEVKREAAARYGLTVEDVQEVIEAAVGGMNLTTTIEGRERYPVNIRYSRELRDTREMLKRVLIPVPQMGQQQAASGAGSGMGGSAAPASGSARVPLEQVADIKIVRGPTGIKSEEGLLSLYVFVDFAGRDVGGYVDEAKRSVSSLKIPEGYRLEWSGEYEYMLKSHERLKLVIPLTLLIIFVLIFLNTKSVTKTIIVLLAIPFSLVGSFWFLYLLNYNISIAVWVGIIALAGLDAETGVVMLLYLELAHDQWKKQGRLAGIADLKDAIMHGAVKRIRPKIMTVGVILAGLIPVMFSHGAGSDVMKRIAAPMVGGVITSTILELIIYPAIYMLWKGREFKGE